jgi:hypothetical protein
MTESIIDEDIIIIMVETWINTGGSCEVQHWVVQTYFN